MYPAVPEPPRSAMTQQEYWRVKTTPVVRFCVLGGGFVCFFMGFLTLISLGILGLLDGLFVLGMGYGICLRRSRACAVIAAAYYAVEQLMLRLIPLGIAVGEMSFMTYVMLALLILSIYGTFTFQTGYSAYITAASAPPDSPEDIR